MDMASSLPRRWLTDDAIGRHNQAIAGILRTPPILPQADGLVLFVVLGSRDVPRQLVALKSLWHFLRRGRVVVLDDGTLTAQDRAVLAQHCGDPEIIRMGELQFGPFPREPGWALLLTMLDKRAGEYWLHVGYDTVTLAMPEEVRTAIAGNRGLAMLDGPDAAAAPLPLAEFAARYFPAGAADGSTREQIESRFGQIARQKRWHHLRCRTALYGLAAGTGGRRLAADFLTRIEALVGRRQAATAEASRNRRRFRARQREPARLPAAFALPWLARARRRCGIGDDRFRRAG